MELRHLRFAGPGLQLLAAEPLAGEEDLQALPLWRFGAGPRIER